MPFEIEDIDPEQMKEMYAYFGLASYLAQCFEYSLGVFILVHNKLTKPGFTGRDFEELEKVLHKKTMGNLLNDLKKYVTIKPDDSKIMDNALERRNYLTHHFFYTRAAYMMSQAGVDKMIEELKDIANDFKVADAAIVAMYTKITKLLGMTDEMVVKEMEKLRATSPDPE